MKENTFWIEITIKDMSSSISCNYKVGCFFEDLKESRYDSSYVRPWTFLLRATNQLFKNTVIFVDNNGINAVDNELTLMTPSEKYELLNLSQMVISWFCDNYIQLKKDVGTKLVFVKDRHKILYHKLCAFLYMEIFERKEILNKLCQIKDTWTFHIFQQLNLVNKLGQSSMSKVSDTESSMFSEDKDSSKYHQNRSSVMRSFNKKSLNILDKRWRHDEFGEESHEERTSSCTTEHDGSSSKQSSILCEHIIETNNKRKLTNAPRPSIFLPYIKEVDESKRPDDEELTPGSSQTNKDSQDSQYSSQKDFMSQSETSGNKYSGLGIQKKISCHSPAKITINAPDDQNQTMR